VPRGQPVEPPRNMPVDHLGQPCVEDPGYLPAPAERGHEVFGAGAEGRAGGSGEELVDGGEQIGEQAVQCAPAGGGGVGGGGWGWVGGWVGGRMGGWGGVG
jgi:hypothetical protein